MTMSKAIRNSLCTLPALAAMLALGACGSSSPSSSSAGSSSASSSASATAPKGVVGARVQAARGVRPVSQQPRGAGQARVTGDVRPTSRRPVKARAQVGMIDDEVSSTGAKALNPCSLVSRTQAQAILGKPVGQPVDAPQGPTCVYAPRGAKTQVTVAVVATNFSTLKPQAHLRDRMSVTVSGRPAYCGVAGSPTMIVPLSTGRYLTVTAPCPIAASFAAKALSHIHA